MLLFSVNIELTGRNATSLALLWGTPDGTYEELSLEVSTGGQTTQTIVLTRSDTSYTVTGLIPGTVYGASLYTVSGSSRQIVTTEDFQTCESNFNIY